MYTVTIAALVLIKHIKHVIIYIMSLYCICTTTTSLAVSCHQLQFHTNWSGFPALQETQKVNGSQCRPSVDRFVRYVALFVRPVTKVLVFLATCLVLPATLRPLFCITPHNHSVTLVYFFYHTHTEFLTDCRCQY